MTNLNKLGEVFFCFMYSLSHFLKEKSNLDLFYDNCIRVTEVSLELDAHLRCFLGAIFLQSSQGDITLFYHLLEGGEESLRIKHYRNGEVLVYELQRHESLQLFERAKDLFEFYRKSFMGIIALARKNLRDKLYYVSSINLMQDYVGNTYCVIFDKHHEENVVVEGDGNVLTLPISKLVMEKCENSKGEIYQLKMDRGTNMWLLSILSAFLPTGKCF